MLFGEIGSPGCSKYVIYTVGNDITNIPPLNNIIEKKQNERDYEMEPLRKWKESFPALPKTQGNPIPVNPASSSRRKRIAAINRNSDQPIISQCQW
ncbi:hypothetical protein JTB14_012537 [Gonioctena quinquepunctata]|nr:hypothetical protein JTB14_012537 [Gonioctena quinquepunctata]